MSDRDLILPMGRIPSLREFLDILRINSTSFAAQLFTKVYDQFFCYSTDLRLEYDRYYCVEYPTLEIYLECVHEIYLEPLQLEKAHILEIKSLGGVVDEAYDDNVRDAVIECMRKLDSRDESQD